MQPAVGTVKKKHEIVAPLLGSLGVLTWHGLLRIESGQQLPAPSSSPKKCDPGTPIQKQFGEDGEGKKPKGKGDGQNYHLETRKSEIKNNLGGGQSCGGRESDGISANKTGDWGWTRVTNHLEEK